MTSKWLRLLLAMGLILLLGCGVSAVYAANDAAGKPAKAAAKKLPKLLDLGSTKCIPCKMMVPVLEELTKDYKGQLDVQFIDISRDPSAVGKYKVKTIPTQILFDAKGKEIWRHAGYIPKADILKAAKKNGIKLTPPAKTRK